MPTIIRVAQPGIQGGDTGGVLSEVRSARERDRHVRRSGFQGRPTMVNIQALIDDAKCFETVREMRWPDGVRCTGCGSAQVTKDGRDETQPERQRYHCRGCRRRFDDLTDTIFAGHHQPLRVWVLCLYFMGLNLSNEQIAQELGIDPDDAQVMASQLRGGIVERTPEVKLSGEVECDEVYVVAGHKGHPEAVRKKGGPAAGGA
jgi:transposase-like protein